MSASEDNFPRTATDLLGIHRLITEQPASTPPEVTTEWIQRVGTFLRRFVGENALAELHGRDPASLRDAFRDACYTGLGLAVRHDPPRGGDHGAYFEGLLAKYKLDANAGVNVGAVIATTATTPPQQRFYISPDRTLFVDLDEVTVVTANGSAEDLELEFWLRGPRASDAEGDVAWTLGGEDAQSFMTALIAYRRGS